jgi:predicted alpha/beta superfamily hydrolase
MKKVFGILFSLFMLLTSVAQSSLPAVCSGKIERIENFQSNYVTPRNIDVWLPEGYSDTARYSVLYMHDGQMLFDSLQTWNRQAWDVDDVVSNMLLTKRISNVIVVAIWNDGQTRHSDYFPQKPFNQLSSDEKDTVQAQLIRSGRITGTFQPNSDNYLKFITQELKPIIDKKYAVYTDKAHTFSMGSSMGGLISLYAMCEYPDIFGGVACLSTHWVGTFQVENNPMPAAFCAYLKKNLPRPRSHKVYFDYGDQTLDALYPALQANVDLIMNQKRYHQHHWLTRFFPGENHSEQAWKKRLHEPLYFLLKA